MLRVFSTTSVIAAHDVCVVGAGPVGIAVALACEDRGLSVLLLESGLQSPDRFAASLSAGHVVEQERHADPRLAVYRGLGGTSRWWGGRCVAFDDIDFAGRAYVPEAAWPVSHAEVARFYPAAAAFFRLGSAGFQAPMEPWSRLEGARFEDLERWTPVTDCGSVYGERLAHSDRIMVLLRATVASVNLTEDAASVASLTIAAADKSIEIVPKQTVLACGGLETTRLLLAAQQARPGALGGPAGALGRYYMGHLSGKIADLVLSNPDSISAHDFFLDRGSYVRRRLTLPADIQVQNALLNIAFWAENPPFHAAKHRSGILSLVWLALAIPPIGRLLAAEGVRLSHLGPRPYQWLKHLENVLRSPIATTREVLQILRTRFLSSPAKPGFLVRSAASRYALHYHAEQTPHVHSRVMLAQEHDALGLPFLDVKLHFGEKDVTSIVRAHEVLDNALRASGLGRLVFYDQEGIARAASVMRQAKDGFHQIGTTRMGTDPSKSVVDSNCRVHGVETLYIASSSVFPSTGQANPTFLTVALAIRLAEHLAKRKMRDFDCSAPLGPRVHGSVVNAA